MKRLHKCQGIYPKIWAKGSKLATDIVQNFFPSSELCAAIDSVCPVHF